MRLWVRVRCCHQGRPHAGGKTDARGGHLDTSNPNGTGNELFEHCYYPERGLYRAGEFVGDKVKNGDGRIRFQQAYDVLQSLITEMIALQPEICFALSDTQ